VRIAFKHTDYMTQARVIQFVPVEPGSVYELSFWYRTELAPGLRADILMTGTGPLYRTKYQLPTNEWLRRRIRFLIPDRVQGRKPQDGGEAGTAGLYVQNRSLVPIWYDDASLRKTNLTEESLAATEPSVLVQPATPEDALVTVDSGRDQLKHLVRVRAPGRDAKRLVVRAYLDTKQALSDLPEIPAGSPLLIPSAKLAEGRNRLTAILIDPGANELLAAHSANIELLPRSEGSGVIDLAGSPVFALGGKPLFPIGMFGLQTWNLRKEASRLKEHGFNAVHDYTLGNPDPKVALAYLDLAEELGFKVMTELPRKLAERDRHDELEQWLRRISKRPAILFYYSDEMVCIRGTPLRLLKGTYGLLRRIDPARPYLPFDHPVPEVVQYTDGLNWGNRTLSAALATRRVLGSDKPLIATVNVSWRDRKAPDAIEQRYLTFMPIILGARGIFYWMYSEARWHSGDPQYLDRLLDSAKELSQIAPAIISGQALPEWMPTVETSGPVSVLRCALGDRAYVLAGPSSDGAGGAIRFQLPRGLPARLLFEQEASGLVPGETIALEVPPRTVRVVEVRPRGSLHHLQMP